MGNFAKWIKTKNEDTQQVDAQVSGQGASMFNKDMDRLSGHMAGGDPHRQGKLQRLGAFLASLGYGNDQDKILIDIRMILNNPEKYGLTPQAQEGDEGEMTGV